MSEDSVVGPDIGEPEGPMLLLGLHNSMSLEDLIEEMPPKPLVDRLVSRSLTSKYPSICKYPIQCGSTVQFYLYL